MFSNIFNAVTYFAEPPSKSITDLRVQLYKKRQQKRDSDFDDSLENAVIESSDDVDDGDTVRTALSGNRYNRVLKRMRQLIGS